MFSEAWALARGGGLKLEYDPAIDSLAPAHDSIPMRTCRLVLVAISVFVGLALRARAETFDVEIPHHRGDFYDKAAFELWLPESAPAVRGVAIVLDGINVDGRHFAGRAQWQAFARDHSLALVACYFKSDDLSLRTYCEADHGGGQALLSALDVLGKASRHPELSTAPIMIMGFSAGGQFSYSFACFCPTRVIGFCSNKGGDYATPPTAAVREIPGLFIAGAKDTDRRAVIMKVFSENRSRGARWCMAIEPGRGHETANANALALPFFDAVLRSHDRPVAERAGIVLDLDHRRLIPSGVPPKRTVTFWFPDEATLAAWNRFMTPANSP